MKVKIGIAVLVLISLGAMYKFINNQRGVDQIYLLPNGFEGCVVINYNVEGAVPLRIEDDAIVYKVSESGMINTSSSYDFGWVNKKHSGSHQISAFYVGENSEMIEELPPEKIRFGGVGSVQEEGKPEKDFFYQIFGSKEVEDEGCDHLIPRDTR